jgi:CheY-like chemotaxis protein
VEIILIVEDDPVAGLAFQRSLEKLGFATDLATDGAKGIQKLKTSRPDAVLLDVMMPKVDGITLLKMLRSDATLRNMPVIVMTNACIPTFIEQATKAGANHVVDKSKVTPLEIAQLLYSLLQARTENEITSSQ